MAHALDKLLETAELFQREGNDRIAFLFVGEGARKLAVKRLAEEKRLRNCVFVDKVEKEEIPQYYSVADAALVVLKKDPLFETVLPSKMFEAMGMGKPVTLGVEGEASRVLEESGGGVAVEPENVAGLGQEIERLASHPGLVRRFAEGGSCSVSQNFNRTKMSDLYLGILTREAGPD